MTTNAISPETTASFGNPLWRNASTNPLTNAALPAAIASGTPIYKVSTTQSAELLLPLQALSLTAYITSIEVTITQGTQTTAPNLPTLVSVGFLTNGVYQYTQSQPLLLGTTNNLYFPNKPDGTPWLATDIASSVIKIIDQSTSGLGNLSSLAVNAISTSIPTVVINPITPITSSTPQITWTYSDADLALQSGFQVQVIDPATDLPIVDSGFITGLDTTYQIPANVTVDNHISAAPGNFTPLTGSISAAWSAIDNSIDGAVVYATVKGGSIYGSTDYGTSFTVMPNTASIDWTGVTTPADGSKVYATASGSTAGVYTPLQYVDGGDSTTTGVPLDGGNSATTSWTNTINAGTSSLITDMTVVPSTSGTVFNGITCSANGTNVYAVSASAGIFVSIDGGLTFNAVSGTTGIDFRAVACSANGVLVYAVANSGSIYKSTNSGATFSAVAGTSGKNWSSVACSDDGAYVFATVNGGSIYTSINSGTSFSLVSGTGTTAWTGITCSQTGTNVYAVSNGSGIYVSINYGSSFYSSGSTGLNLTAVVSDNNASKIYVAVTTDQIYAAFGVAQYIYRVRVTKNINGHNNYTPYSSFTPIATTYNDSIPIAGAVLNGHNVAFTIALADVSSLGYVSRDVVVLRKWSGGYGIIRNGTISNVGLGATTVTIKDLENPTATTLYYKIKEVFYDAAGNTYVGTATSLSISVPALPSWWIQRCDGVDTGIAVNAVISGGLPVSRHRPQTHMYPLGSRYPVTVSSTVQGYDGDLTVYFDNNPAWLNFLPYLDYIGKLLISGRNGSQKYVTLDKDDVTKAQGRGTDILRDMHLVYTEEDSGLGFNEPVRYEF